MKILEKLHLPGLDEPYRIIPSTERPVFAEATERLLVADRKSRAGLAGVPVDSLRTGYEETDELFWRLDDPEGLITNPDTIGRWEESVNVHATDWSHMAELRHLRNILRTTILRLDDSGAHPDGTGTIRAVHSELILEADIPETPDLVRANFSSIFGGWSHTLVRNGAAQRHFGADSSTSDLPKAELPEEYDPIASDLVELAAAADLLTAYFERFRTA